MVYKLLFGIVTVGLIVLAGSVYKTPPHAKRLISYGKYQYLSRVTKPPPELRVIGERARVSLVGKLVRNKSDEATFYSLTGDGWKINLGVSDVPFAVLQQAENGYVYIEGEALRGEFFPLEDVTDIFPADVVFVSRLDPL